VPVIVGLRHEAHFLVGWMCTEVRAVLTAVAMEFLLNCWYLAIRSDNRFRHVPRYIHNHAQSFRLEGFKDFYDRSGNRTPELFVESFDFLASSQYILVSTILSCFRFVNMCLRHASFLSRCKQRYLTSSCCGRCTLFIWTGRHVSSRVLNVTWTDLDPLVFTLLC
jgi:hypothetical protein